MTTRELRNLLKLWEEVKEANLFDEWYAEMIDKKLDEFIENHPNKNNLEEILREVHLRDDRVYLSKLKELKSMEELKTLIRGIESQREFYRELTRAVAVQESEKEIFDGAFDPS